MISSQRMQLFPKAFVLCTTAAALLAGNAPAPANSAAVPTAVQAESEAAPSPTVYDYSVIEEFPHDPQSFTQGLFFADGILYESTGHFGRSQIIRHDLFGDASAARTPLPDDVFGEGAVAVSGNIISVTWRSGLGFVHDAASLERLQSFPITGEGWGLTYDGERLVLSDGTNRLRFLDPETFKETGSVGVTANGRPVPKLNELEFIDGEVWANVWQTDLIVRIAPETGHVTGVIDLTGLRPDDVNPRDEVLNGIAYDPETDRLLVTGKHWPTIYQIELVPRR